MDLKDLYVESSISANPVVSEVTSAMGDAPFEPVGPEFLAHCRKMLGARALEMKIEESLAGWREAFSRRICDEEPLAKKVLTASVMLIAAHDAVIAALPPDLVPQVMSLVASDPRTIAHAIDLKNLIPEEARSLDPAHVPEGK